MIQPNQGNNNREDLFHEFSKKDCKLENFNKFNVVKHNSGNTGNLRHKC